MAPYPALAGAGVASPRMIVAIPAKISGARRIVPILLVEFFGCVRRSTPGLAIDYNQQRGFCTGRWCASDSFPPQPVLLGSFPAALRHPTPCHSVIWRWLRTFPAPPERQPCTFRCHRTEV